MTMRTKGGKSLSNLRIAADNQARFVTKVTRNAGSTLNRLGNLFVLAPLKANDDNEITLNYIGETDAGSVVAARQRIETVLGETTKDTCVVKLGRTTFKIVLKGVPTVAVRKAA